ncbi:MAG: methyltransferase domain-containing protein, partial [Gammaproteobacteria bacterium]|nr:methyltransferase domain-containing protein [Gammaproteobacteria bacterium]
RAFIPGYEAMLRRAAEEVAGVNPERVLDLGAGTGALAEAILEKSEAAVVELVDVDGEMLGRAGARLRRFGERARLRRQSFSAPLPNCDAVAASLALHHVPDIGAKTALFARIARALRPAGIFVNADVTMPEADPQRAADYATWAAHLFACGISEARAYQHFEEWSDEDTYFPLDRELRAMREAGFDADCVWRQTPSTVLVGRWRAATSSS